MNVLGAFRGNLENCIFQSKGYLSFEDPKSVAAFLLLSFSFWQCEDPTSSGLLTLDCPRHLTENEKRISSGGTWWIIVNICSAFLNNSEPNLILFPSMH